MNNRLSKYREWISDLEDRIIEVTQLEQLTKINLKKWMYEIYGII